MSDQMPTEQQHPVTVPASLVQAGAQHRMIGTHLRAIARLTAQLAKQIERLKTKAGERITAESEAALALARGIYLWAETHKATLLTEGKKSYPLPRGGSIEWADNDGALEYDCEEKEAVAALEALGLKELISYSPTVNKTRVKEYLRNTRANRKKKTALEKIFRIKGGTIFRIRFAGTTQRIQGYTQAQDFEIVTPRRRGEGVSKTK